MTEKEVIKLLMKREKISQSDAAERMGLKNSKSVAQRLGSFTPRMNITPLLEYLDMVGAELIIRKDGEEWVIK